MLRLSDREWRPFTLENIFSISSGKRLENRNKIPGRTPFVGAAETNNGVTGFVKNINESLDRNVLGVNYNGAPGYAFYHRNKTVFSDDVKRLHLKHWPDSQEVLLFLAGVIDKQRIKYGYGYKFNAQRMKRQILLIPVDVNGTPDYEFMGAYIKERQQAMLNKYVKFAKQQLEKLGGGA